MKRAISIILCVILLFGISVGCRGRDEPAPDVDAETFLVTPSAELDGMIPTDACFNIELETRKLSESDAQRVFRFNPPVEFTVQKLNKGFQLKPCEPFSENAIVNLQALGSRGQVTKSWAFQTQTGFSVLRTTPADGGEYVPITSGIEMQFSHANCTPQDFLNAFTLTNTVSGDNVAGEVRQYGDTFAFVPKEPLAMLTTYNAVLSGDFSTTDGTKLGNNQSFFFRTAQADGIDVPNHFENASPITETFLSSEAPVIAVYCDSDFKNAPMDISVYRFRSAEDYTSVLSGYADKSSAHALMRASDPHVDLDRLDALGTFQTKMTAQSAYGMLYIVLPGDYEKGWYYIHVSGVNPVNGREVTLHKFIQISDLSVYYVQTDGSTLFWLNNARNGQPLSDAAIRISGAVTADGASGPQGTALINAAPPQVQDEPEEKGCILTVRAGDDSFIDIYQVQAGQKQKAVERYVSYLYTDRPIYMSTDRVYAWGLVRPRAGETRKPENLRLAFGDYREDYFSVPVKLAPDGTFTAELPFERMGGMDTSTWFIRLKCDEEELYSKSIEVGDYVKPVYSPSVSFDKPVYWADEPAEVTFRASFFDNTPASNFSANLTVAPGAEIKGGGVFLTDEDGEAKQQIVFPGNSNIIEWRPQRIDYSVNNAGGENENFGIYGDCHVLYRDLAVRGEADYINNQVTVRTNRIDVSNIRQKYDMHDTNLIIGEPVDSDVTVEIHKEYYTEHAAGSYYDYVEKRKITYYKHHRNDDIVEIRKYRTTNGVLLIQDLPVSDAKASYYLKLIAPDSKGLLTAESVWLGNKYNYPSQGGLHSYSFSKRWTGDDYQSRYAFNENEAAAFEVLDNGMPVDEGKVLYAVAQKGFLDFGVEDQPQISIPFEEKLVPNYDIIGAYFDGKHVYKIRRNSMLFDPETRRLSVELESDRDKYAPGGTAAVKARVTYGKDGPPVPNAAVSLSLADEAVFAIQDQTADPLSKLYRHAFMPDLRSFVSYIPYNYLGYSGAEMGGGGGGSDLRSDFKDTAAFLTGMTGEDGRVQFDIPLPDNLTTWRATVQAVSQDLSAGDAQLPVVVTKDFFLNEVLAPQYLTGDNAMATLRAYGGAVSPEEEIRYTATVEGNGARTEKAVSGTAKNLTGVPLGELQNGSYTVTMTAQGENGRDAVQKTIQVTDSGVESWMTKSFDLNKGPIEIQPEKFPVTVGFYNSDYSMYAKVLNYLQQFHSFRTDARIARRFSQERMREISGEPEGWKMDGAADDLSDVLSPTGYVSLFSYDSPSLPLAARVHLAVPDLLPGARPVEVFYNVLGNQALADEGAGREDMAMALLGLAAHKEPILAKVRGMLADGRQLSAKSRLYLTAALAALGDVDGARGFYSEFVTPMLAESRSGGGERMLHMHMGDDINENIEYTALASFCASMTRSADADGMMEFLMANRSTRDLYVLEGIVYLRYMEPQGGEAASVSYRRGGETAALDLGKKGMRFLQFTSQDFSDADIRVISGNVFAQVSYIGSITEAADTQNNTIQCSRTMEVVGGGDMKPGSIVKITLRPVMPRDVIDPLGAGINDYIPSGMRYLGLSEKDLYAQRVNEHPWHLASREGQRVSFYYSENSHVTRHDASGAEIREPSPGELKYNPMQPLTYYVRCAAPGEYIVDNAYIRSDTSPDWGVCDKSQVTIHE